MTPEALAARIAALRPSAGARALVALVGPPGAGKSTLAGALRDVAHILPMDGFHLDDRVLRARGLLPRKGAPETFDVAGLGRTLEAVRAGSEVIHPVFDRSREIAIAGAGVIPEDARPVVVEGNWLLLDRPGWTGLGPLDLTLRLDVPEAELRRRLEARWAHLDAAARVAKIDGNDLPNARLVAEHSRPADLVLPWS